jgi:hypothetical protein
VSTQQYDKWKPGKIDQEKVKELTNHVRFYLDRIQNAVSLRSYMVEDYYGDMFEHIEELYGVLDINSLAQDNKRRYETEKKRVRRAHGNEHR